MSYLECPRCGCFMKRDPSCSEPCCPCHSGLTVDQQLAESKQREATLTQERDAALSVNQHARNLVDRLLFLADRQSLQERLLEVLTIKPAAALAERDRAIERKVLDSVIADANARLKDLRRNFSTSSGTLELFRNALVARREFNLEPKT